MAGETPNANRVNNRRKLRWSDDKSTNKIYASGDVSALGTHVTSADSTLKPGQKPAGIPTPVVKADDKSADKYYAEGGSKRVRGPQVAAGQKKLGPPPALGVKHPRVKALAAAVPNRNGTLLINSTDEMNGVLAAVVDRAINGPTPVLVCVKRGDNNLLKRARAAMELLVAREVLTEEQYHDIRLSYDMGAEEQAAVAAKLGVPTAITTVATEDNESVAMDPLAFLNGDDDGEPAVDTSPLQVTNVDTSNDVASSEAPSYPTAPQEDDDDGADNTFLTPSSPAVFEENETPAEAPVEAQVDAPTKTTTETPVRPGRRHGRGTK